MTPQVPVEICANSATFLPESPLDPQLTQMFPDRLLQSSKFLTVVATPDPAFRHVSPPSTS
jgi:hypothetical protein